MEGYPYKYIITFFIFSVCFLLLSPGVLAGTECCEEAISGTSYWGAPTCDAGDQVICDTNYQYAKKKTYRWARYACEGEAGGRCGLVWKENDYGMCWQQPNSPWDGSRPACSYCSAGDYEGPQDALVSMVNSILDDSDVGDTDFSNFASRWVNEPTAAAPTEAGLLELLTTIQGYANTGKMSTDIASDMSGVLYDYYGRHWGRNTYHGLGSVLAAHPDLVVANTRYADDIIGLRELEATGATQPDQPDLSAQNIPFYPKFQACHEWLTPRIAPAPLWPIEPFGMPSDYARPIARGTDRSDLTAQVQTLTSALPFDKQFLATMVTMYFSLLLDYAEMMQADFAEFQEKTNARIAKIEREMLQ